MNLRRLAFNILALASLLLLLAAGGGWLLSYVRPINWYALDVEHHPNWIMGLRGDGQPGGLVARKAIFSESPPEGYWRAWWIYSRGGRLTLVHQEAALGTEGGIVVLDATTMYLLTSVEGRGDVALYIGPAVRPQTKVQRLEFTYERSEGKPLGSRVVPMKATLRRLTLPYWPFVLLGLPLPLLWLRRRLRATLQARQGLCAGCGYDLRETPERCPECGREAGARQSGV